MPSSTTRSCGLLNFLCLWLARLTAAITRSFRPVAPELPLFTLNVRPQNSVGIPSVPEDATETEQLVFSSHWQSPRFRYSGAPASESSSSPFCDGAQNSQDTADSSKAAEFTSLFSVSPVLPALSPLLSMGTPPLIQMSPTSTLHSPKMCASLLDPEHGPSGGNATPASDPAIGELGKRRGFKGAPLFTPETTRTRRPSFLSLSSAFSPNLPLSPRPSPSTPRTPLATVTNLIRSSTAKSPLRPPASPKPLTMEPPVSDELQQCYNLGDPFSVTGEAFFTPEFVCESVPLLNLQRFDVYRPATPKTIPVRSHKTFSKAVEAASRTKPRIRETNVYDMMVYNFQPQAGKKKPRKSAAPLRFLKLSRVSLIPTTMACLRFPNQEPRVRMPRHLQQERKILPEHADARPVPWDFSRSLRPILTWESQDVLVNMSAAITSKAPLCAHIESDVPSPSLRRLSDPTNAAATPTRRQSGVLEDLLAMLDVVVVELESSDGTELPKDISVVAAV